MRKGGKYQPAGATQRACSPSAKGPRAEPVCSWPLPLHAPAVQAALSHTKGSTRAYRRPAAKAWCTHRNVVEQVALLGGCLHGFQRHVEGDVAARRGGRASSSFVNMRKTPVGSLIASRGHVEGELAAVEKSGTKVWGSRRPRQDARCASRLAKDALAPQPTRAHPPQPAAQQLLRTSENGKMATVPLTESCACWGTRGLPPAPPE